MWERGKKEITDEAREEYFKELEATYSTQGYKKLWNYFLDVVKSEKFQNKILEIRRRYRIPEKGYDIEKVYYTDDIKEALGEDWKDKEIEGNASGAMEYKNLKQARKIHKELDKLCSEYYLHYLDWGELLQYYFYYNILPKQPPHLPHTNSYNLCLVSDLAELAEDPFTKELTKADNEIYPIGIRISPYASKRDIVDFVNKMFPVIKGYQKLYIKPNVRIGKVKKKKRAVQERNNFIYENKALSLNELKKLIEERFGEILDYEYIGKIKSDEAKRRKEL